MSEPGTGVGRVVKAMIRTFVCIEMPETIRDRMARLQLELKQAGAEVSWVKPSNIHLTLKFLGQVPHPRIPGVCSAVERAARVTEPFEIEVSGTGCFPSMNRPRVLWVGLSQVSHALSQLQAVLEDELASEGFARETRRFAPHLTIGRLRSQRHVPALLNNLKAAGFEAVRFRANEMIVMRSDLKPTGALYTPQTIIPLGVLP
ncbi:MAG: RNA 2',3'-cyclic phosphodiesterase [Acidobacteria bacterium]|nr:MAG: RNA 2',3'-cyclic phosphodiesterase [Acidobacteriota bacterium]